MNGVEPNFLLQLVIVIGFGISVGANVTQVLNGRKSQKREVVLTEQFATRAEMQELAERVEDKFEMLRTEIQEDKSELLKAGEARVVKLHDRINEVLSAVSELRGEVHAGRRADK